MRKAFVTLKDIVIPAGTIVECVDGSQRTYIEGNYSTVIGLTKDSSGELVYGIDLDDEELKEWFREIIPAGPWLPLTELDREGKVGELT